MTENKEFEKLFEKFWDGGIQNEILKQDAEEYMFLKHLCLQAFKAGQKAERKKIESDNESTRFIQDKRWTHEKG